MLAALGALLVARVLAPAAVPLFDGISFPDEPYRFVAPPPGYRQTPEPTAGHGSSRVDDGTNAVTIYVDTAEQAPQISIVLPGRVIAVGPAGRAVTVAATPLAPDRQPSKGSIDGNVYRVTGAATPSASVSFAPPPGDTADASFMLMRATSAKAPPPVFVYRTAPSVAWRVLPTSRWGNDIYRTRFAGMGDYALAFGASTAKQHKSQALPVTVSALLVVILAAAGAVVAVRVSRRRTRE